MKYLFIALLVIMVCGCGHKETKITEEHKLELKDDPNSAYTIREFEYDGCQYIAFGAGSGLTVTHKGNCKYCQQRNK